ncbi:CPBP family intramembrane glutamic endopeptidase [Enterococcus sp. LJL98]
MSKLIYLFLYFLITTLIPRGGVSWDLSSPIAILSEKWLLFLLGIVLFSRPLWMEWKQVTKKHVIIFSVIATLLCLLSGIVIAKIFGVPIGVERYSFKLIWVITNIFVVPLVEELAYRYAMILPLERNSQSLLLRSKIGRLSLIVLSSSVFMLEHAATSEGNLILLIPYLIMGLLYGFVYYFKNNLWYSLGAHIFYNASVLVLSLVMN